jgi:ubiquinone/menaquinone biosynthesis C-methylase UbiE
MKHLYILTPSVARSDCHTNSIIPFANKRILEVGCGWGSFFDFGFTCQKYTGIDINENFIKIAKQRYSAHEFICIDINQYYS